MILLALLEVDRLVCSGRWLDGAHTYAAFADRVIASRHLDRGEALAELAVRYFLRDVRRGLAQVGDQLASFDHDGRTFWHAPGDSPPTSALKPAETTAGGSPGDGNCCPEVGRFSQEPAQADMVEDQ